MKKFLYVVLFGIGVLVTTINYHQIAQSSIEIPFGGMHILTYNEAICTCGGNSHFIIDYRTKRVITLYKAPISMFYEWYNSDGLYQLGTYIPTAQHCFVATEEGCYMLQYNDGQYGTVPGTGTTLL